MSAIFDYINRLCRKIHHVTPETITDSISTITNTHSDVSIPLTRFIQKRDDMSVGNIIIIETDVRVRITVFILLLMILE